MGPPKIQNCLPLLFWVTSESKKIISNNTCNVQNTRAFDRYIIAVKNNLNIK